MQKIGLLTSGGDAPGMNAAIRAVVRTAIYHNRRIFGIRRGYTGLINGDFAEMDLGSVADIIHRGGTVLQTSRCPEFQTPEGRRKALENLEKAGIEGLVVIGGEGTFRGILELNKMGMPTVGIPGTIDNDIPATDRTIGFDTVINTVVDAINKIRDTATSHERVFVIEVMGRHSGEIALAAGIAGGAESIMIPEVPLDVKEVVRNILRGTARGKRHSIILVAEGFGDAIEITADIQKQSGLETRLSILGYIQRGGPPSAQDRLIASRMGSKAVTTLLAGEKNKMVAVRGEDVLAIDMEAALRQKRLIREEDYLLAGILSI